MEISLRLQTIATFVPQGSVLADIGSDHGHLLAYLLAENRLDHGYATELKNGPYLRLKTRFINEPRIIVYQADGLEHLPRDVTSIVIAGMGGLLITKILEKQLPRLQSIEHLILCPHQQEKELRTFMMTHGFHVSDETIIAEAGQFYSVIVYRVGPMTYDERELEYGPFNLKRRPQVLLDKMQQRKAEIERILAQKIPNERKEQLVTEKAWLQQYDQNK